MNTEVKRLNRKVNVLYVITLTLLLVIGYGTFQIKTLSDKVPDYQELKNDVEAVKSYYDSTKEKAIDYKHKIEDLLHKEDEN